MQGEESKWVTVQELQEFEKRRKFMIVILGSQKIADGIWKKKKVEDCYRYSEKVTDAMQKRRQNFYEDLIRMAKTD